MRILKLTFLLTVIAGTIWFIRAQAAPTPIATVPAGNTVWVDTTPGPFQWCYYLTAYTTDSQVSVRSNVACATPVQKAPPYTLTVTWIAPTQNTDNSALTNLAGYYVWRVPPNLAAPVTLGQPITLPN